MRHGGFAFALQIDGNARKCWLCRFAEIPFIVHANYGHRLRDAKSEFAADAQNVCGRNVVGDEDTNWFWHGGKRLRARRANGDAQSGTAATAWSPLVGRHTASVAQIALRRIQN